MTRAQSRRRPSPILRGVETRVVKDPQPAESEELYAGIWVSAAKLPLVVAHQLLHCRATRPATGRIRTAITIRGTEGMAVELAKCCHPIPGDPILGFIHKDRGLIIHTHDCPVITRLSRRPRKMAGRGMGSRARPHVRRRDQAGRRQPARRAGQGGGGDRRTRHPTSATSRWKRRTAAPTPCCSSPCRWKTACTSPRIMRGLRVLPDVVRIFRIKGRKDGRAQAQ